MCGKALYDEIERCARKAFFSVNEDERRTGRDILWYLWNGPDSPLYGRDKMTTFERYFIEDESTHKEKKDVYYKLINDDEMVDRIFAEFGAKVKMPILSTVMFLFIILRVKVLLSVTVRLF